MIHNQLRGQIITAKDLKVEGYHRVIILSCSKKGFFETPPL